MKLDRFINRPVLSTVISVLIVILGILGLISLPITQYPDIAPPTIQVSTSYTGANAQTRIELSNSTVGRGNQRCGEYGLYVVYCNQYRCSNDKYYF